MLAVVFAGVIVGRSYLVVGDFALGALVAQVVAALAAMTGHIWPVLDFLHGNYLMITELPQL